ncbi:hypothetical protein C7999DRAFT_44926 [Corynascus novoguineensis]|uniref:Uncharacterized protein n=1 Tax=Corynascus novoguineensis TaxID=1126955 RepID=A0AAN7HII6_9PEZI|nr:hypothetical protein C7999DRAFT_44926 [Corynascus novoguineensis]
MKYNNIGLGIFILYFRLPSALGAVYHPDAKLSFSKQEVVFDDPNSCFDIPTRCKPSQGKQLTLSQDKKWATCCPPGTILEGSEHTAFEFCGAGHSLAGIEQTGYRCYPPGQTYDSHKCKKPDSLGPDVCQKGRIVVNGKCVCPGNAAEAPDGTWKCYLFKMENGQHLRAHWQFKFCKDQACVRDVGNDINSGGRIRLMDLHGEANSGKNPNQWLNNAQNGGHIGRTDKYENAGVFTISKWTKGKCCLSGLETGVGPTCPSEDPSLTFNTLDTESCLPLELIPVPCGIRDPLSNCLWSWLRLFSKRPAAGRSLVFDHYSGRHAVVGCWQ